VRAVAAGLARGKALGRPDAGEGSVLEIVNPLADEKVGDLRRRVDYAGDG
jgi:hypothetical protein